jgi:hypothetical protein
LAKASNLETSEKWERDNVWEIYRDVPSGQVQSTSLKSLQSTWNIAVKTKLRKGKINNIVWRERASHSLMIGQLLWT